MRTRQPGFDARFVSMVRQLFCQDSINRYLIIVVINHMKNVIRMEVLDIRPTFCVVKPRLKMLTVTLYYVSDFLWEPEDDAFHYMCRYRHTSP